MKRSQINAIMKEALDFCDAMNFRLPPFVSWTPEEWQTKGKECAEITENQLGWDITDFGGGDFDAQGLMLITLRNGNFHSPQKYGKPYAEKIMIVRENQVTPMHYHEKKREDIINRGGGNLVVQLYNKTPQGELAATPVTYARDGVLCTVSAGEKLCLAPGESLCMTPGLYHSFWGEEGHGLVLVGEVSQVNDDHTDNHFLKKTGRFPAIEEDTAPFRLLCTEYPTAK